MKQSFPVKLFVPDPLLQFFDWQEANGLVIESSGELYGKLDPAQDGWCMHTQLVHPGCAEAWIGDDHATERDHLAPFMRTGGDGSMAALWRDDAGNQHFVHLPSGSGSTMLCVLASDPVDFLRLLAIGYEELCWPENLAVTPEEEHSNTWQNDPAGPPFVPRKFLKHWVEQTLKVDVPRKGEAIVKATSNLEDDSSPDPFWNWMTSIQRADF